MSSTKLIDAVKKFATVEEVKSLLDSGVDVNEKDWASCTALIYACSRKKNPKYVENMIVTLLDAGAEVNAVKSAYTSALLNLVCNTTYGSTEKAIKILLAAGAEVDARGHYGITPLMETYVGEEYIVKILLEGGADTAVREVDGYTALHMSFMQIERYDIESTCIITMLIESIY